MIIEDLIVKYHSSGMSQKSIALKIDKSLSTVRRIMKRLGLVGHSKGIRSYNINSEIFNCIDTETKAYWLGFLLADGCLAKSAKSYRAIRLSIQDRDKSHLEAFASFIGYKGKLHENNTKGHRRLAVIFNDVNLGNKLIEHGWMDYKVGNNSRIFEVVPSDLFNHFVRGYFDGDGCIAGQKRKGRKGKRWYANICCKFKDHLTALNDKIMCTGGPETTVRRRSKSFDLRYCNKGNVAKIYRYLYDGIGPRLERKINRFYTALGNCTLEWYNIHDFKILRQDENTQQQLVEKLISDGWANPKHNLDKDLADCRKIDLKNYIIEGEGIRNGLAPGNKIIQTLQPIIYRVKQNNKPTISELSQHPKIVERAVTAFLKEPKKLYPARLIRELNYAGLTQASILSVPVMMAAIRSFKLQGEWFDPCAGWGNRMLTAYLLDLRYRATDPGICYSGLLRIQKYLSTNYRLDNKKYQDYSWTKSDFILTSPPFYNKEDYLDNINYGSFDNWYNQFLIPLIEKSLSHSSRVIMHVDNPMLEAIKKNYYTNAIKLYSVSRHKAPKEWFVEIFRVNVL